MEQPKLLINPSKPPPLCFSCGNSLLEKDFDKYHELLEIMKNKGEDEDYSQKIILDSKLSKCYHRVCCRIMFLGDAIEFRRDQALYNFNEKDKEDIML